MDLISASVIGLLAVAFLMYCSTKWWKMHWEGIEGGPTINCEFGISADEIGEIPVYDGAAESNAVICTGMTFLVYSLISLWAVGQFIPGKFLKVFIWLAGTAIIIFLPYFCGKKGKKKGR